jgi:hypothetical protein
MTASWNGKPIYKHPPVSSQPKTKREEHHQEREEMREMHRLLKAEFLARDEQRRAA